MRSATGPLYPTILKSIYSQEKFYLDSPASVDIAAAVDLAGAMDEVRQANFRGRWYFKGRWNSLVPVKLPTPMELRSDGGTPGHGVRQANTWGPMDVRGLGGVRKLVDVKMPVDWVG